MDDWQALSIAFACSVSALHLPMTQKKGPGSLLKSPGPCVVGPLEECIPQFATPQTPASHLWLVFGDRLLFPEDEAANAAAIHITMDPAFFFQRSTRDQFVAAG